MLPSKLILLTTLASVAALSTHAVAQVDFRPFGILPGAFASRVTGLSADGSTAVGVMQIPDLPESLVTRWTFSGGAEHLPEPSDYLAPFARAVSGDGSVIVGSAFRAPGSNLGFRWTQGSGYTEQLNFEPSAISDDAQFEVGRNFVVSAPPRRSMITGQTQFLGAHGSATAISRDGGVVIGSMSFLIPGGEAAGGAWRWTAATGQQQMEKLAERYGEALT